MIAAKCWQRCAGRERTIRAAEMYWATSAASAESIKTSLSTFRECTCALHTSSLSNTAPVSYFTALLLLLLLSCTTAAATGAAGAGAAAGGAVGRASSSKRCIARGSSCGGQFRGSARSNA
jgi:hypothetical protein